MRSGNRRIAVAGLLLLLLVSGLVLYLIATAVKR
jgi:hypothetical protein